MAESVGVSKQQVVYIFMCLVTVLVFLITFNVELRNKASFPIIRRFISYKSSMAVKPALTKDIFFQKNVSFPTPTTPQWATVKTSTYPIVFSVTSPTGNSKSESKTTAKVLVQKVIPSQNLNLSSDYPNHLKLDTIGKLTIEDLRYKTKSYNVSKFAVPKIIHQSWKVNKLPPRFIKWSDSWKKCYPDWKYMLWTDKDNDIFVKTSFPWFYKRYTSLSSGVQKADAVRYLYLFAFGGIYADLDDECLKPFLNLLEGHSIIFGAMSGHWFPKTHVGHLAEGYVQNSFMYSVPGHPFWLNVIETIMNRPRSSSAESTTGPFMLQEVIGKWRSSPEGRQSKIKIYPPNFFNPFSWLKRQYSDCKDVGGMNSKEIDKCKAHYPMSYVIQYHTQTWGRGARHTYRNDR